MWCSSVVEPRPRRKPKLGVAGSNPATATMRSFIGATGAFLPEARALCSHAVLGRLGPPEPFEQAYARAAGTMTIDGRSIRVREVRPGEEPLFYSYPSGHPVGWVEERSAAGSVVDVAKALSPSEPPTCGWCHIPDVPWNIEPPDVCKRCHDRRQPPGRVLRFNQPRRPDCAW